MIRLLAKVLSIGATLWPVPPSSTGAPLTTKVLLTTRARLIGGKPGTSPCCMRSGKAWTST